MGERGLLNWVEHGQLINDSPKIYRVAGRSEGGKKPNNSCAVADFLLTLGRHLFYVSGITSGTGKFFGFSNKLGESEG